MPKLALLGAPGVLHHIIICGFERRQIFRSYLKKVFWPNFCVGASFQVLDILEYACGLKPGPALILNQNPFFEIASRNDQDKDNFIDRLSVVLRKEKNVTNNDLGKTWTKPCHRGWRYNI
jgi:hypothetical protein